MKRTFSPALCGLVLVLCGLRPDRAAAADYLTVSGTWGHMRTGTNSAPAPQGSASFNASLPFGYRGLASLDPDTRFTVALGSSATGARVLISHLLVDDPGYTAYRHSATFKDHGTNAAGAVTTTITSISWTTSRLTIACHADFDLFSAGPAYGASSNTVRIDLFDTNFVRFPDVGSEVSSPYTVFSNLIFLTANNSASAGLSSGSVSGGADFAAPRVAVTSPVRGYITTNATLTFFGTVSDNVQTSQIPPGSSHTNRVWYALNSAPFAEIGGGARGQSDYFDGIDWATPLLDLRAGTNVLYVRAVDAAGNTSAVASVTMNFKFPSTLNLAVVPDARNGLDGAISGNATNHETVLVGAPLHLTALPDPGFGFNGWSISNAAGIQPSSQQNPLVLAMSSNLTLLANFTPTTNFTHAAGQYSGLFLSTNGVPFADATNSGFFSLNVGASGAYSGLLTMLPGRFPFSGQLAFNPRDRSYFADASVRRGRFPALPVQFGLADGVVTDDTGDGGLPARVAAAGLSAMLSAAVGTNPLAGTYNLALNAGTTHGYGYGTLTVAANGQATLAMNLADAGATAGPAGISSGFLTAGGSLPVFMPLYPEGRGVFFGEITVVTNLGNSGDITATNLAWVKFPGASATFYTNGFDLGSLGATNGLALSGSFYAPPASAAAGEFSGRIVIQNLLNPTNPITANVVIQNKLSILTANTNLITLVSINPATGLVSGTFLPDANNTNRALPFNALFQHNGTLSAGQAFGFYSGTNATAAVELVPACAP